MEVKKERRTDYTFEILREDQLEETCKLIYKSFAHTNPLWKKFSSTYEDLAEFLRWRVRPSIATQTSSVMICDGKIVGAQVGVDLVDYQKQREENFPLPEMFKVITKYHNEVIGETLHKTVPRGTVLMNHYTAVDPDYQNQGFYPAINKNGFRVVKLGYVDSYTITTNPITQGKTQSYKGINNLACVKFEDPAHPLFGTQIDLIEVPLVDPTAEVKRVES